MTKNERRPRLQAKTTKRVAIVGGGIAGLYASWRLLQDDTNSFEIHLFERDDHVGGRIHSVNIPGIPFLAELGAMRFRPRHQLLNSLICQLEIPKTSFDLPQPAFHFRGRSLSIEELAAGSCDRCNASSPFILRENERGVSPVDLVQQAIRMVLKGLSFPGLKQGEARRIVRRVRDGVISHKTWRTVKQHGVYQGVHLHSLGFWNLLQHFLSNEALVMVRDVLSLESILGNWNAAEAIPWFLEDFASDQYEMIPGGMSTLITRLSNDIQQLALSNKQSSFQLHTEAHVSEVHYDGAHWTLSLDKDNKRANQQSKHFDCVILAVPKMAAEKFTINNCSGWPPVWLDKVREHRMFKLFLLYDHEWWIGDRLPGHDNGRVFTDLPLRQIYYFSPTWMEKHGTPNWNGSESNGGKKESKYDKLALVMASYSDEHNVSFWEPMLSPTSSSDDQSSDHDQPYFHKSPRITPELWQRILNLDPAILANKRMVDKVRQQLSEIHGRELPEPIVGIFRYWGNYPFGGGWHTWNVGTKPWEFEEDRIEPVKNIGLFMCGEAYSNEQGWMEGALKSTELVLSKLRVPKPRWIKDHELEGFHNYISLPRNNTAT